MGRGGGCETSYLKGGFGEPHQFLAKEIWGRRGEDKKGGEPIFESKEEPFATFSGKGKGGGKPQNGGA